MARGYPGAFGRKLNAPYVWIPLCLLFLLPFVDFRRPFRLLHLDLLVLLALRRLALLLQPGEIGVSVPLVYPVLLYLLARMLFAAFRPRRPAGPLVPHVPLTLLVVGLVFLAAFRIGLNVVDSNVIDVGYAGVIGADRIVDGDGSTATASRTTSSAATPTARSTTCSTCPSSRRCRWSGRWDDLPAAHGAAIAFDLLALGGLLLLGRRLRPGREGTALGVALAYAWVAYPYTAFVLETNSNDTLVARRRASGRCCGHARARPASGARGAVSRSALGAAAKFATARARAAVRAPLAACVFARRVPARCWRSSWSPFVARRRPARALRPDDRLPGESRLAVQHLGPGRLARLAPGRRSRWPRPASRSWWRFVPAPARACARWPRSAPRS